MNTDLQKLRVAVAETEGWKFAPANGPLSMPWRNTNVPAWDGENWSGRASNPPPYTESRDAIIGAIVRRFVTVEHKTDFYCALHKLIREHIGGHWIGGAEDMFALATATAEQLCRAYCAAAGIPAT